MRKFRLVLLAMLVVLPFAVMANAQVGVGIGVGPAVVEIPVYYAAITAPRIASGATTPITRMPAPLTAITVLTGFTAASFSASARGTAGAGMAMAAGAVADTATVAADTATAAVDMVTVDVAMRAVDAVMPAAHVVMPAVAQRDGGGGAARGLAAALAVAAVAASTVAVAAASTVVAAAAMVVAADTGKPGSLFNKRPVCFGRRAFCLPQSLPSRGPFADQLRFSRSLRQPACDLPTRRLANRHLANSPTCLLRQPAGICQPANSLTC